MPCIFPTAGARMSTLVLSDKLLRFFGGRKPFDRSGEDSCISDPVPMSPISPSTSMEGLIAFSASTACLVWRTFSSRASREVKDNGIKAGFCRLDALGEGVRMVCVKKNGEVEFLAQTSHESRNLTSAHKLTLTLGQTNQDWHVQFSGGGEHRSH